MCAKEQVIKIFASFSTRERELYGLERLPNLTISDPATYLRLGRTKLVGILELVAFDEETGSIDTVAAALVTAAEKEMA
jgi:hypothetical protein